MTLDAEEGGVIWPFLHQCDCGDPYEPYSNPKVGKLPSCTISWQGLALLTCSSLCMIQRQFITVL